MLAAKEDRGPVIRYVPNEVCIVVDEPLNDLSGERLYALVHQRLNQWLRELPQLEKPRDRLERDLLPTPDFWAYLRGVTPPLRAVTRLDGRRQQPWITLAGRQSQTRLLFYVVGPSQVRVSDRALAVHQRRIRDMVNLINWQGPITLDNELRRVVACTPNWMVGAAHTTSSPGTAPEAVQPDDPAVTGPGGFRFQFVDERLVKAAVTNPTLTPLVERQQQLAKLVDGLRERRTQRRSAVAVAVLDTCPTRAGVAAAATRYPTNLQLKDVVDHPSQVVIEAAPSLQVGDLAHVGAVLPNWRDLLPKLQQKTLVSNEADHGLFVAGIIRDIAPQADVHLIRALDDDGTGDLLALATILRQLPDIYLTQQGYQRLVVNLSLTVDIPAPALFLQEWLPQTATSPTTLARRWPELCGLVDRSQLSLRRIIDWLTDRDVAVVAAAGNDADGVPLRPAPAPPAVYEDVLSVAAVTRRTRPSRYSNRGDQIVFGNGVAIFGGDGQAGPDGVPRIPPAGADRWRDAVAGLFSNRDLPLAPPGARPNATGWVWWSGTSFASPVVAAIVADLLLTTPSQTIPGLMQTVRGFASIDEATLEATAGPFDCSAIFARQVFQP